MTPGCERNVFEKNVFVVSLTTKQVINIFLGKGLRGFDSRMCPIIQVDVQRVPVGQSLYTCSNQKKKKQSSLGLM